MDSETMINPTNDAEGAKGAEGASAPTTLGWTDSELATGALAVLGGVLLLRMGPVRSLLKLGLVGAAGWAAYRHVSNLQDQAPSASGGEPVNNPLAEASQRLANAWGAHYRDPEVEPAKQPDTQGV